MSKLTRELFIEAVAEIMTRQNILAYDDVMAHDQAQRDELVRVEKELGQVKLVYTPELRTIQTAQVQQLQADLATVTRERDELMKATERGLNAGVVALADGALMEAKIKQLEQHLVACREALRALHDEQNDAPLETRRTEWLAAMNLAKDALKEGG